MDESAASGTPNSAWRRLAGRAGGAGSPEIHGDLLESAGDRPVEDLHLRPAHAPRGHRAREAGGLLHAGGPCPGGSHPARIDPAAGRSEHLPGTPGDQGGGPAPHPVADREPHRAGACRLRGARDRRPHGREVRRGGVLLPRHRADAWASSTRSSSGRAAPPPTPCIPPTPSRGDMRAPRPSTTDHTHVPVHRPCSIADPAPCDPQSEIGPFSSAPSRPGPGRPTRCSSLSLSLSLSPTPAPPQSWRRGSSPARAPCSRATGRRIPGAACGPG